MYMHVYIYIYTHMHVCVCEQVYINRKGRKEGQTDGGKEGKKEKGGNNAGKGGTREGGKVEEGEGRGGGVCVHNACTCTLRGLMRCCPFQHREGWGEHTHTHMYTHTCMYMCTYIHSCAHAFCGRKMRRCPFQCRRVNTMSSVEMPKEERKVYRM